MKKIFSILIFSLFLTGSAYAECTQGNCQNWQGTFTSANGDKYVGEYKNDLREGLGTYTFADGTTESGIWKNGGLVTPN